MRAGRRRMLMASEQEESFWPSFADLTSTVSLILFVLVLLAYVQNLVSGKSLSQTQALLASSSAQLSASRRTLMSLRAEIDTAQARLLLSQAEIEQQRRMIEDSNRELSELRARLSGIAVLRVDLLQRVKGALEAQLPPGDGAAPMVTIANNGNIVINERLVFDSDSYTIKKSAKPLLDTLARAFANVLADPVVRESVDVVLIQGHTDERGTVGYNRDLSSKRANAVLDYLLSSDPALEQQHGAFFASSAYSEFRPIDAGKTEAAYERNRRIEISVVLKDASVRSVIDEYMRGIAAAGQQVEQPATP